MCPLCHDCLGSCTVSHGFISGDRHLGVYLPCYMSNLFILLYLFIEFIFGGESAYMEVKGQLAEAISVLPPRGMKVRSSSLVASTSICGARSPIPEKSFGGKGSFLKLYISHPALSS